MATWTRRGAMAGAAALTGLGTGVAGAQTRVPVLGDPAKVLDTPALRGNRMARAFREPPAGLTVPVVNVERREGVAPLKLQPGLTLVSLWAPWCAPCLHELGDLARLQEKFGGKSFRILPILTSPREPITAAEAGFVLKKHKAGVFAPVIDRGADSKGLFQALSMRETPNGPARPGLPCNLLVSADGAVLARQFGAPMAGMVNGTGEGGKVTPADIAKIGTLWATFDGEALMSALARGEIAGGSAARPRPFVS
ncbi:TlpA disulfide reductase family protein [Caulobacter radicis]|uniref:TlpA disulfide reductase family protein n=1 Tax=Caulobacter radicis TaxID=2172650 RepID=UPI0010576CA1|nr:TlpA disulfide reductase family protein [Caulobacter radicis]